MEIATTNGHISVRKNKLRARDAPFLCTFHSSLNHKIKGRIPWNENTYIDFLAYYGIGSAHPGGFTLTKQLLAQLPLRQGADVLEIGCGTGKQRLT